MSNPYLELANVVREERKDLRLRIRGSASFEDGVELVLASLGERCVKNLPLEEFLKWIPRLGGGMAKKKMNVLGLNRGQKLVGALTDRERLALAAELGNGKRY